MITKLLIFILMLCIVFIMKEAAYFAMVMKQGEKKYDIAKYRQWMIVFAIAYILTIMFTGF